MSTSQTSFMIKLVLDAISCAFDYQYYFFFYINYFKLNENETIGLEVKDDVSYRIKQ